MFPIFKTHHLVTLKSLLVFMGMTDKHIHARTPVWTAFITHLIQSRFWISQPNGKIVQLAELSPYIFTTEDNYKAQKSEDGKHELVFRSSEGK